MAGEYTCAGAMLTLGHSSGLGVLVGEVKSYPSGKYCEGASLPAVPFSLVRRNNILDGDLCRARNQPMATIRETARMLCCGCMYALAYPAPHAHRLKSGDTSTLLASTKNFTALKNYEQATLQLVV
jgi:hypothetical protein